MKPDRTAFLILSPDAEPKLARRSRLGNGQVPDLEQADAFKYSAVDGTEYWVAREGQSDAVRDFIGAASLTLIDDAAWPKVRSRLSKAIYGTGGFSLLKLFFELGVPCVSEKAREFILSGHHLRSTIADFIMTRDLSGVSALVLIHQEDRTALVEFPDWIEQRRLTKIWYAFKDIDSAMSAKLLFPSASLIELS